MTDQYISHRQLVDIVVKQNYVTTLVLLPVLLLNGCSKQPDEQLLVSKTWILSSYRLRDDKKHKLTKGAHYYLNFYAYSHLITLSTSCPNQGSSGKYRIDDQGRLFILKCYFNLNYVGQRCPDDDGSKRYQQEKKFINEVIFLSVFANKYHIRGNELRLTSSDGEQLVFTGVTNGSRMNYFEQLLDVLFWKMLFPCETR